MGKTIVAGLTSEQVIYYQDQLKALIEKPLKKMQADKYYDAETVIQKCASYEWQCWAACSKEERIDCVFITHIDVYPKCKTLTIYLVGGECMNDWLAQAWEVFKGFAKVNNCIEIIGMGRMSWIKALKKVEQNEFEKQYSFSVKVN